MRNKKGEHMKPATVPETGVVSPTPKRTPRQSRESTRSPAEGKQNLLDKDFDEVLAVVEEVNHTTPPATYKPQPKGFKIDDLLK